jgi:predicted transposase/invertase (TIGR01784 family)
MKMKENHVFQVLENDEILDIRKDNVFKAVFTKETPESRGALSSFVSALIGRNVSIASIHANEPPIANLRDRQLRLDINCKTEDGEIVNVEMSLNPDAFEPVRLEFHTAKLYIGQDIRGSEKTYNDLKRVYQIAILANERFFPDEAFFHIYEYYDHLNKVSLNGRTKIITLELSKLDKIVEKSIKEMSVSERWAVYFNYLTDSNKRDMINEILKSEEGIAMTGQVLMSISRDEEERYRIMRDEKIELDYQSRMATERLKGREEEREKWLHVVANKDAQWQTVIAEKDAENARLREQLEKLTKT